MTIRNNRIVDIVPEVTEWRRWLHRHPELLFDLPRTYILTLHIGLKDGALKPVFKQSWVMS